MYRVSTGLIFYRVARSEIDGAQNFLGSSQLLGPHSCVSTLDFHRVKVLHLVTSLTAFSDDNLTNTQ